MAHYYGPLEIGNSNRSVAEVVLCESAVQIALQFVHFGFCLTDLNIFYEQRGCHLQILSFLP